MHTCKSVNYTRRAAIVLYILWEDAHCTALHIHKRSGRERERQRKKIQLNCLSHYSRYAISIINSHPLHFISLCPILFCSSFGWFLIWLSFFLSSIWFHLLIWLYVRSLAYSFIRHMCNMIVYFESYNFDAWITYSYYAYCIFFAIKLCFPTHIRHAHAHYQFFYSFLNAWYLLQIKHDTYDGAGFLLPFDTKSMIISSKMKIFFTIENDKKIQ